MVDVDPSSGMKGNTLRALAEYRRRNGQIIFGIFLKGRTARSESEKRADMWLEEGDFFLCE
jgi:molybdenum cofactor sulfurtransferase